VTSVRIEGGAQFERALAAELRRVEQATARATGDAGLLMERQAKLNATGRPGPRVVTGNLRRRTQAHATRREGAFVWSCLVDSTAFYAGYLDPEPYPFFTPAYDFMGARMPPLFQRAWAAALS
jgi:hypothetical protein